MWRWIYVSSGHLSFGVLCFAHYILEGTTTPKVKVKGYSDLPVVVEENGSVTITRESCKQEEQAEPTTTPEASPTMAPQESSSTSLWGSKNLSILMALVTASLLLAPTVSATTGQGASQGGPSVSSFLVFSVVFISALWTAKAQTGDECSNVVEIEIEMPTPDCPYNNIVDGKCLNAAEVTMLAYQAIFIDNDEQAIRKYVAADYIQHNPNVPNGVEPIVGLSNNVAAAGIVFDIYRIFYDGDVAVTHNVVDNAFPFGAETFVVVDVFRTANGQVVQHWDNIQVFPSSPNPSNRTVIDGPVMIKNFDETEANKKVVTDMVNDVFVGGNVSAAPLYISNTTYLQHNPNFADGLDTFMAVFQGLFDANLTIAYDVKYVYAQGNYVFIMAEGYFGTPGDELDAYFDLFRLDGGMIVEHWDVIEHIPPLDQFANGNGKW